MTDLRKPKVSSSAQSELDKAEAQFDEFDQSIKELTMDRMNLTRKQETDTQTKMSQEDIRKSNDVYLKPIRTISCREKFNEKYRDAYEFDKEYVNFFAENKEIIGESIDIWTKPYAGVPAEEWLIPTNKPIWAPRYVAEQIKRKFYHRLKTEDRPVSSDGNYTMTGQIVVDTTVQRLDAVPVINKKSIFMGSKSF